MADQPNSLFESNTPNPAQQQAPASNAGAAPNTGNEYATLLSSIKNERGEQKYATLAEALVGLQHAQNYIPQLKAEQAQRDAEIERLRVEALRVKTLEETLSALNSQQPTSAPQAQTVFDESKLADLVNQTLTRRQQADIEKSNQQMVVSTLQQSFGADAEKKFDEAAAEMGLSRQEMNALAAKSPKLILTALGVKAQTNTSNAFTTPGSVNTSAFTPQEQTLISRNPKSTIIGATTKDIKESADRAKRMVDELHSKGMSAHDLSDPKVYNRYFN
jgi:hypothetical protein